MKNVIKSIAVVLGVSGAFAFMPKDQNYCFYQRSGYSCLLVARPENFTFHSPTGGDRYIGQEDVNDNCPSAVALDLCKQQISYTTD